MHGVVQKVLVRLAYPDRELAAQLRTKSIPVLLEYHSQIVLLPMLDQLAIDLACLRVPKRRGFAISGARTICRVPRAPLLARHRVAVAESHRVFHLTLVSNSKSHFAVQVSSAGALKAMLVCVRVRIVIDVDQLKRAKVDAIRISRPRAVEKLGIENLKRKRNPSAR